MIDRNRRNMCWGVDFFLKYTEHWRKQAFRSSDLALLDTSIDPGASSSVVIALTHEPGGTTVTARNWVALSTEARRTIMEFADLSLHFLVRIWCYRCIANRGVLLSTSPLSPFAAAINAFLVPPPTLCHSSFPPLHLIFSLTERLRPASLAPSSSSFSFFFRFPLPFLYSLPLGGDVHGAIRLSGVCFAGWEMLGAVSGLLLPAVDGEVVAEVSAAMERSLEMRWVRGSGVSSVVFASATIPCPPIAVLKVPTLKRRISELSCRTGVQVPSFLTYLSSCLILCPSF